jgi:hypothetical protein
MKMSQGNSLYKYHKQIKMSFYFYKIGHRRAEQILSGGLVPMGDARMWEKGCGG